MRSIDVANYLIGEWGAAYPISNLKLNKLVYYSQVESLVETGMPLFDDRIEAWQYGPVEPAVYRAFSAHGRSTIVEPLGPVSLDSDQEALIDCAAKKYCPLSAFDLVSLSHRPGGAWAMVYRPDVDAEITPDIILCSTDAQGRKPEPFSKVLDDVAGNMPNALKMLEDS